MSKVTIQYKIEKFIKNKLVSEDQTITIHPDSWPLIKQIFIEQGWRVTFHVV